MYRAFVAGAGGIGSAVALLLREVYDQKVDIYIGDINQNSIRSAQGWIAKGGSSDGEIIGVDMTGNWQEKLPPVDIVLDCLPGKFAPMLAAYSVENECHYVNLTEYVAETKQIMKLAKDASTGFGLQAGLAPGFVNILGKQLFEEFCQKYSVKQAQDLEMRVGALPRNSISPHFYGFTWSTIGVATEYVKAAEVVRNHQMITVPSLSGRRKLLVDGVWLEEDITSGGAADIPMAYKDVITNIDYKTLRYPGHWAWVDSLIEKCPEGIEKSTYLEQEMLRVVPTLEDDLVVVYAAVQGKDSNGLLRRIEASYQIEPIKIGEVTLRSIQSSTAAGMAEVARILLENRHAGVLLQSQVDVTDFMTGPFVSEIYGERR
jgi:saccharopine dehydrogenase-like NADP-dependent oxidoreductase